MWCPYNDKTLQDDVTDFHLAPGHGVSITRAVAAAVPTHVCVLEQALLSCTYPARSPSIKPTFFIYELGVKK